MIAALLMACATAPPADSRAPVMVAVPLQVLKGHPYVSVQVNTRREAALFLLDTGASITILTPLFAKRLELAIPDDAKRIDLVGIGGNKIRVPVVKVARLAVGDASVENVNVAVYDVAPAGIVDGILGLDFLKRFRFTIDAPGKRLRLETPSP